MSGRDRAIEEMAKEIAAHWNFSWDRMSESRESWRKAAARALDALLTLRDEDGDFTFEHLVKEVA